VRERPPIIHGAGVPSAFLAASIAASSTSSAARLYVSLDCHTRSVSASTSTPARSASGGARVVGHLARDDRDPLHVEILGPREHATDDLARETRPVELSLPRDREVRADECGLEPDRLGHDLEAGHELRADRGESTRETAGRARARQPGHVDSGARAVAIREHLEPAREQRHLRGTGPLLRREDVRRRRRTTSPRRTRR